MKLLTPTAQLWLQPEGDAGIVEHVARCARVCRQVQNPKRPAEQLCADLIKQQHLSMFRHVSYYFAIPNDGLHKKAKGILFTKGFSPYAYAKRQKMYLFVVNGHTWLELSERSQKLLSVYRITEERLVDIANAENIYHRSNILSLLRTSVSCITQISTTREMNRTSPNNIVEQSTRYVNFGKKGGVAICQPHWYEKASAWRKFLARASWKIEEWLYMLWLKILHRPEDARGYLPLDTASQVIYTYTAREWHHIMDLRLRDLTGKAHPNAKQIAQLIKHAVDTRMQTYDEGYEV